MTSSLILREKIENKIYLIRGKKVMIDTDLAELYNVETRTLIQSVKRNIDRFPEDFMFQLSKEETELLRSQIVISSWGGRRYFPYAFTEQGVAMLSSVLSSKQAIQVNIQIMRTFTKLREIIEQHKDLRKRIDELESKYDKQFQVVFNAIKQLMEPPKVPKRKVGFNP